MIVKRSFVYRDYIGCSLAVPNTTGLSQFVCTVETGYKNTGYKNIPDIRTPDTRTYRI